MLEHTGDQGASTLGFFDKQAIARLGPEKLDPSPDSLVQ